MEFETERLTLRPWRESDAEALYLQARDPYTGPAAGWNPHESVEESRSVIRTVLSEPDTYAVVLKETQQPVGSIGLFMTTQTEVPAGNDEMEIGYWIGTPYRGRGLIPEAIRCLLEYAFVQKKISVMWCGYFDGNERSRHAQEKCGFVYDHTERDIEWAATGTTVTEHFTRLTRCRWEQIREQNREQGREQRREE